MLQRIGLSESDKTIEFFVEAGYVANLLNNPGIGKAAH